MAKTVNKEPDDHVWCPACGRPYSFVRCRVTLKNPTRNRCLPCGQEEMDKAVVS